MNLGILIEEGYIFAKKQAFNDYIEGDRVQMWWNRKKQAAQRNDEVYEFFNSIFSDTEEMENNERQDMIWSNCFRLSRWIFATNPNNYKELFYARGEVYGNKLCVFAFTDEQHLKEFSIKQFGHQGFFIASSPQEWVESLSDSGVERIVFNAGPKGWSWFAPIENLRSIQEYVNR